MDMLEIESWLDFLENWYKLHSADSERVAMACNYVPNREKCDEVYS